MTILAMWSGPRNISTALMYSFGNRADCEAVDEPFYGFALKTSGHDHPMRDDVIASMPTDWHAIVARCTTPSPTKPLVYQKHMTHHMLDGFDRGFITRLTNAFLIRRPEKVLASYAQKWSDVTLDAIGFVQQAQIFDQVADHLGRAPPVIDADDVLADPRGVLTALCAACGIGFDEAMLRWPQGPKPFDGVWAPHWYQAVWASEGFGAASARDIALPPPLQRIADAARPIYERLEAHAITG
jgi:Sulfotransferase domain